MIYSGMCNSVRNVNPFHQVAGKLPVLVFLKCVPQYRIFFLIFSSGKSSSCFIIMYIVTGVVSCDLN